MGGDIADILNERVAGVGDEFFVLFLGLGVYYERVELFQKIEDLWDEVERDEVFLEFRGSKKGRKESEESEEVVETAVRGGGEGNESGEG